MPSTQFTEVEMTAVKIAVDKLGKGFWMIGGESSFGVGGYLHTPIEEILPVDLKIREQKKSGYTGIALDRSGSMSMSIGPNLTKMDLANQGASSAINY